MGIREAVRRILLVPWLLITGFIWPAYFIFFSPGINYKGAALVGKWWLFLVVLAIAYAPLGITFLYLRTAEKKARRVREEQRQAEQKAEWVRHLEAEELRRKMEVEDRLRRAQAHKDEVQRFYRERLSIEQFVVGDELAGIRSPYEVEMTHAEVALLNAISTRFDPSCLLVDTYVDKGDGTTTQIDLIAICRQGVIVFESKGLAGSWSGKWDDQEWKQQPSGLRIYNPIRQNAVHVEYMYRVLEPTEAQLTEESIDSLASLEDERHVLTAREDSDVPLLAVLSDGVSPEEVAGSYWVVTSDERFPDFGPLEVAYALMALSDDERSPHFKFLPEFIYSVVVFNEGARFPDLRLHSPTCQVAGAHRVNEALDRIMSKGEVLSDLEVMEMAYKIRRHRVIPDRQVRDAHVRGIQVATGRYGVLE